MNLLYGVVVLALMLSINFVLGEFFFDTKCKCSRICLEDNLKIFKKHFYCFYFLIFEKGIVESKTHLILHIKLRERERNVLNIYEHLF